MLACCIAIIGFGKTSGRCLTHCDWRGDLQLIAHTLIIQFKDTFAEHFSPHWFGVATLGMCETMVHGVRPILNLHLEWVVLQVDVQNIFNSIFQFLGVAVLY
jgi:hypothetical protein